MKTIVYKLDETQEEVWLKAAEAVLAAGGLVAIPTETVYGLAADALDEKAAAKIYEAKGRPSDNPLIVHISDIEDLNELVAEVPEKALKLAEKFWPGPLTMILPKSEKVPYGTTGGLDTVAIRMPSHPAARKLIHETGIPLAAPSANTSGRPSPTKAEHVLDDLDGKIDMILDDGPVGIGIESTIVDLSGSQPMILRPGYITQDMLREVIGDVSIDPAILDENVNKDFKPKAPGMKYKHYAPKGDLSIVVGSSRLVVERIQSETAARQTEGYRVGVIATDETLPDYEAAIEDAVIMSIGTRKDENTITHNLYDILRRMDLENVDYIYSESFEEGDRGSAIMNRLLKAAGHHCIYVD